MSGGGNIPSSFVDAWIPDFVKSVEMFTGTVVTLETREAEPPAAPSDDVLWHEQSFEHGETGRFWIGAPTPACVRLMGDAAENESAGTALFRELTAQSMKAAAEMLNTGSHPGFKCLDTPATDAPPASSLAQMMWITASGSEPIPVWLHCDAAFAGLLDPTPAAGQDLPPGMASSPAVGGPDGLHGIDLPVIVVLGRATLRISEVLKLTVGSVVELDTRVGDPVDICVQNVVVARGEVVSIRGNYGVRIVEVLRPRRPNIPPDVGAQASARAALGGGVH